MSSSRIVYCCLSLITFTLLICGPAAAQHQHAEAASSATSACTSTGFGTVHHPVKTSNPQAQGAFEHGLALDYGFNHNQAEKCFQRAAELDPSMAMAYWGIALVLGTNYNLPVDAEHEKQAYDAIQKALTLSTNGPANERAYIEALANRYTDKSDPDYEQLEMEYHGSMRALYKKYPADLDAATLFAESGMNLHPWKLWSHDGTPSPGTEEIVAVLKSVLQRDPHHLGANHFYIHAVEASSHPEAALPSARRLAALAPESGHLVHMPAHIFIRTGDHESSEKTNVAAARADEAYFKVAHPQGVYPMMYYTHNLHFIAVENAFMGRYAAAMDGANRVQANVAPHLKEMSMLDAFNTMPIQIMVRFHRWDEIMALPPPDASLPMSSGAWHFARAMACANGGKLDQASAELAALRKFSPEMAKVSTNPQGPHNAEIIPRIMAHFVEARIANAERHTDAVIENLREAVSLEDSLDYDEPPDWMYPIRESLGAALLQASKPTEAESVFREDLKRNARNPRSMFGLAESLKAQGKAAEAQIEEQQFKSAWRNADTKLTIPEL
jgi:tetratricopeptide (TPR) repeat protein